MTTPTHIGDANKMVEASDPVAGRCAVAAGSAFWHELTDDERDRIKATPGLTVGEFMNRYRQPTWCEYPEALGGQMGCWSLVLTNRIHSIDDCKGCDCCTSPNAEVCRDKQ